jgi:hypothetical protein
VFYKSDEYIECLNNYYTFKDFRVAEFIVIILKPDGNSSDFLFYGTQNASLDPILTHFFGVHLFTFYLTKVRSTIKAHPLYEHGYVMLCVGNLTEEKCCVCKVELAYVYRKYVENRIVTF